MPEPVWRRPRLLTGAAIFLCSLLLPLIACEAALRFMDLYAPPPEPPVSALGHLYERFDPHGYRLWPSRVTTYLYPPQNNPRQLTLTSNRHGFRGRRELDEPDARKRIVVLGDSMVFGQGVEETERFTEVLESFEPGWRVDNLGMTGFGPDLMLRALEQVGLAVKPDAVVLVMYTDDFRRVHPLYAGVGFPILRYVLRSGKLTSIPYPELAAWQRLHLSVLLRRAIWRFSSAETDLNAAILDRFLRHATDHRFVPAIVFLPGTEDNPGDKRRRSWLRDYSVRTRTPFLDLTDPIHGAADPMFIRGNFHLNPAGHKMIAQSLRPFLNRHIPQTE